MTEPLTLTPTADGSLTAYHPRCKEHYHNRAGAYTEALKNYVEPADPVAIVEKNGRLSLLDVCFGLGYNTWVLLETILASSVSGWTIHVVAIEQDPEILRFISQILEDPRLSSLKSQTTALEHNIYYQTQIGCSEFIQEFPKKGKILWKFFQDDLRQVIPKLDDEIDLVFHDPFSPRKLPGLWTMDLFQEYYRLLEPKQGRIYTYSAASAVRGGLQEAGFIVEKTQGVGEKSGGTVGYSDQNATAVTNRFSQPLSEEEVSLLYAKKGVPYRDPTFCATDKTILENRLREQRLLISKPTANQL
ncbi:MAG: hypothetical protein KTR14_04880, partial [Vampirovibrio sp.]|nr:hypothetical protein [Vampirovibrio sp.]